MTHCHLFFNSWRNWPPLNLGVGFASKWEDSDVSLSKMATLPNRVLHVEDEIVVHS
jgi:hypothetical protein